MRRGSKMKRTGIRISFVLILVILTFSSIIIVPALQDDSYSGEPTESLDEETNFPSEKEEDTDTKLVEEAKSDNYIEDEFFEKYGSSSGDKNIDFSTSLNMKLASTPESLWSSTDVQLIVSFDKRSRLLDEKLTIFQPEILDIMPLAIVNTNLAKLEQIYSIKGVKGVYLNENYQIAEGWNPEEINDDAEFHTYPSEALIGARELLDMGIDGTGIKIAILDTGIDKYHPDLDDMDNNPYTNDPKVILEKSFIDYDGDGNADTDTSDGYGHGTHCAGIAAGNGILKGVAPNAWLINGRIGDDRGYLELSWLLKAIDWAVISGADIISMSLGWGIYNVMPLLNEAADYAWERGVILTVSAGNSGPESRTTASPGMASRSITVGASTRDNTITSWSSRGPSINGMIDPDVVAPGSSILSTYPGNRYYVASGTSMSAPAVAGVAALLLSSNPDEDIGLVRSAIISTATDLGYHVFTQGTGLVNAKAAYEYLQNPSVYAFPGFSETSTLVLSPGEEMEYQFDIYLDDFYSSLSIVPASELVPYLTTEIIDPVTQGWVRAKISITMPIESLNSSLEIKDGSTVLFQVPLCLELGVQQNDAGSGTDAGELLTGAVPVAIGDHFSGRVHRDGCDFYSFPVVKGQGYGINLTQITDELVFTLHDENGTMMDYEYAWEYNIGTIFSFEAISTGDYFINALNIYNDQHVNYTLVAYTTELTQDPIDIIYLTGNYDDYAIDDDDNGLYEELAITVEVYVNTPGEYEFYYRFHQKRFDYNFPKYYLGSDFMMQSLTEGFHEIVLTIDGKTLEASDYNGNYILGYFSIGDLSTYRTILAEYNLYTTSIYRSNWFEQMDNRMLYYFFDDVNIDNSGGPELLEINAVFVFTEVGTHPITMRLIDSSQNYIVGGDQIELEVPEAGVYTVSFTFSPQNLGIIKDIVLASFSGSCFEAQIFVYEKISKNKLLGYDPLVSYSVLDTATDTDSNGKYDSIEFTFIVNSKISGDLSVYMSTVVSLVNETSIPSSMYHSQYVNKGMTVFKISWEATRLRHLQILAPLLFADVSLYFNNDDYYLDLAGYYVTRAYNYMEFEYPNARFTGFLGYEKFFTNDTGGYEFTFEVTATKTVDIKIRTTVSDYDSEDYFYEYIYTYATVVEGKNNVTVVLDYTAFAEDKYTGDLIISTVYLYRFDNQLLDSLYDVAVIEDTNYLDFINYFDTNFIGFQTEFVDNNTDGLYEGVYLHFTVNVSKIGTYDYTFYTYDFLSYYSDYGEVNFNSTGIYNITFFFSAELIVRELERPILDGNLYLEKVTETYLWQDWQYFAIDLNRTNFAYDLPFEVLSVEEDFAYDVNDDGLFDGISFTIKVNNTVAGYPQLRLYLKIYSAEIYILDSLTLDTMDVYYPAGIQNITFTIQSSYLKYISISIDAFGIEPIFEIKIVNAIADDNVGDFFALKSILNFNNTYNLDEFDMRPAIQINEVITELEEPSVGIYSQTILITIVLQIHRLMDFEIEMSLRLLEEGASSFNPTHYVSLFFYPTEEGEFNYTIVVDIESIFVGRIPESIGLRVSSLYINDMARNRIDKYYEDYYIYYNTNFAPVTTEPTPTPTTTKSVNSIAPLIVGFAVLAALIIRKRKRRN